MPHAPVFQHRDGLLHCEEVPLSDIAAEVGTPCYVYSRAAVLENFRRLAKTFSSVEPLLCFAVKANSNLSLLRLLREEGSGFDVVSLGELYRLRRIGADPGKILFSGVGKTETELLEALDAGILSLNVESIEELRKLVGLASRLKRNVPVSFRINPDIEAKTHPYVSTGLREHKFGIDFERADEIQDFLERCPQLELRGLGYHIGSQILQVSPFLDAFRRILELSRRFEHQGFPVEHLDLGGGFGIPYRKEEEPGLDLEPYARLLEKERGSHRLIFEPGRVIVGDAGVLLCRVLYRKQGSRKQFLIVDGAMNDLMRPSLYQAHHEIRSVRERPADTVVDVVGPVCESGDFFARDRLMPALDEGDLVAVMNTGAYGFVLASNYNSRPRPAEVLVEDARFRVVRRRETLDDLIRGE